MKATSPTTLLRAAVGLALVSLRACAAVTLVSPKLLWLAAAREPHPMPLKAALVDLAAKTRGGARATAQDAADAAVLIEKLELCGGVEGDWADRGPAMAGVWEQIYTDNPNAGTVAGDGKSSRRKMLGPLSGRVQQLINYEVSAETGLEEFTYVQRARSYVALGLQAELRTTVEAQPDGQSWSVAFDTFGWSLLGGRLPLRCKALPEGRGGTWLTTYLDVDTRVMKAYSAGRDGPPTTYFLKRSPFSYYYPLEEDMMVDCEVDP